MEDRNISINRPFRILGIDHVVIRTTDIDRALTFYCDVLGCEVERKVNHLGLIQLRAGTAMIDLLDVNSSKVRQVVSNSNSSSGHVVDHICLQIENFENDHLMEYFKAQNIDFGDVTQRYGANGYGPSLYIIDPDGNTLELKGLVNINE